MGVGVRRVVEHVTGRSLFDESPRVEHADAVAHPCDESKVMADEQDRGVERVTELGNKLEHLSLDRRIKAGRGLVEDEQAWVRGERHGDNNPLLLASRELMRIAMGDFRRVRQRYPCQSVDRRASASARENCKA